MKPLLAFWNRSGLFVRGLLVFALVCAINWTRMAITGDWPKQPLGIHSVADTPAVAAQGLTLQQYGQLQTGMSYERTVAILGRPGEEISSTDIGGIKTVMYQWKSARGANMNAMFQDGALISKAQFGLN